MKRHLDKARKLNVSRLFCVAFVVSSGPAFSLLAATNGYCEDFIWTSKPVRIDRSKQNYERLPPRLDAVDRRTLLVVPFKIEVADSTHFQFGEKKFQLAHLFPIAGARMCQTADGGKWTCGRAGKALLGNLVRGKTLLCEATYAGEVTRLARCIDGPRDVAATIVENGMARVDNDPDLKAIEETSIQRAVGIWQNPRCIENFDHC